MKVAYKTILLKMSAILLLMFGLSNVGASEYRLYILGGQSNMDGLGLNSELPDELKTSPHNVMIFHGNPAPDGSEVGGKGLWQKVRAGHGNGFRSNGLKNKYANKFGPELSFAHYLSNKYPNDKIAIIKYSRSATSIDCSAPIKSGCWEANLAERKANNQYDHYLATLKNALAIQDIDGDGQSDTLNPRGLLWMQGESDALMSRDSALNYLQNLSELISAFRTSLGKTDLPVVIAQISDSKQDEDGKVWDFGEIVQAAQAEFVLNDPAAFLIEETKTYEYSDPYHYDSDGFLKLGKSFGRAIVMLELKQ